MIVKNTPNNNEWYLYRKKEFEFIIEYTYAEKYYGNNFKSYSLIVLDENRKPINSIAWFQEEELILVESNIEKGLDILDDYYQRRNK